MPNTDKLTAIAGTLKADGTYRFPDTVRVKCIGCRECSPKNVQYMSNSARQNICQGRTWNVSLDAGVWIEVIQGLPLADRAEALEDFCIAIRSEMEPLDAIVAAFEVMKGEA